MELNKDGVDADASVIGCAIDSALPVTTAATTTATSSCQVQQSAAVNVDALKAKISALEAEFLGAWQILEFLSSEYLIMWERLETVELLLYQQQATIARLVGTYGDTGGLDEKQPTSTDASAITEANSAMGGHLHNGPNLSHVKEEEDGDDDDDDRFAAKVEAQLRSLESSEQHPYSITTVGRSRQSSRLSADEAFYRSLNYAHRDSPSMMSESDNELRMIWESSSSGQQQFHQDPARTSEESIGHVFSAQDYCHYRRGNTSSQDVWPRGKKAKPPDDLSEDSQTEDDEWAWRNNIGTAGSSLDCAKQIREIERVSRKLKRDSQRLQELRERLVQSSSIPQHVTQHTPVDPGNDLHEQLRLAFLESARQKSARLHQRQQLQQPQTNSLGYSSSTQQPSIYSGSSSAAVGAPVHIDPLHLGRSNSSENVSPSFSSYLRTPMETQTGHDDAKTSNTTSPLLQRSKSPTSQTKTPVIKTRSVSEEIAPNCLGNYLSTASSRSPSKIPSASRSPSRRGQQGLSPTRVSRISSMRSDSGVSSLSGNWSSMDPERSPVSPSQLLVLAGHHSSTQQQVELINLAPPPPAPADGPNTRPSSRMMYEQPAVSPSTRSRSTQPSQIHPHLTTETWNVQGSICSVATAAFPAAGSNQRTEPYPDPVHHSHEAPVANRARQIHPSTCNLSRNDSTWIETEIDNPFLPTTLDDEWYSPRGVVHPQNAPQHHYRSNTPSPAPGSLPEGHFVPEPANVLNPQQQNQQQQKQFQYPTLTFEPCQEELVRNFESYPSNYVQQSKSAGCSPKQRRRLHSSPTSSITIQRFPQQKNQPKQHPNVRLEHQISSPGRLVQTTTPAEQLSSSSSIDYYDLYYQTPSMAQQQQQQPCYMEHNHNAYDSQEGVYLFRNPLPNYEEQSPYETRRQSGQDEEMASSFGQSPSPFPTYTTSSQVIVSQCGYISIATSSGPSRPISPGKHPRNSPRKKIRSAVNQLFNRPKLKNRSVSLPGVDAMQEIDRQHLPHSASGSTGQVGGSDDGSRKRFSFSRTSSLPGLKKGKKMMKQLTNIIGGRRGSNDGKKPGSLQSLSQQSDDWTTVSRRPLKTLDVVGNHSGEQGGNRAFVSYCNEGFDSGNDWDDDMSSQVATGGAPSRITENSLIACMPGTIPVSDPSLMTRRPSGPSSGEFAASRALGRYRRMAAAEAAATTITSPVAMTLPDVAIVSSSGSQPENRRKDRPPSGSDDDASLSLSLNLDFMSRHQSVDEQQDIEQQQKSDIQEIFFPKVAIKPSPKRSQSDACSVADDSPKSCLTIQVQSPPPQPADYLEPVQLRPTGSIESAPASPRPLANVNRTAPRWQSTEDSIDVDDEWYRYGMMQLEEMERRAESGETNLLVQAARQYNQQQSYGDQMQAVLSELQSRVPVHPAIDVYRSEPSGNKTLPYDDESCGYMPSAQENWEYAALPVVYEPAIRAEPPLIFEEENDDWAAYTSSPNRAGLAAQEPVIGSEQVSVKAQDEDDEDDDYSSGETSGPDSPHNQSFDDDNDNDGGNELFYPYEVSNDKEPEYYDATRHGGDAAIETTSSAVAATSAGSYLNNRHSLSGTRGSTTDIFPSSGNILSAAGSTASNIASSVFSFFTSTTALKDGNEELCEPQPNATDVYYASANNIASTGATATTTITTTVESPGQVAEAGLNYAHEGDDNMDSLDAEQQKMLTLTAKGSAARWKLVKTLRDKKAETASVGVTAASPTNNESVRENFSRPSCALHPQK